MLKKILVVDEVPSSLKELKYSLEEDGYIVDVATDGEEAYSKIRGNEYDLVILDLVLPKLDGFEVCKQIRTDLGCPIIILTEKDDDSSKVSALEFCADDYITKPFNILELKARIKAIFRRLTTHNQCCDVSVISIGGMNINTLGRKVQINNEEINLTAKEFDLLLLLAMNRGKVYSREELLEIIWGYEYFGDVRTVDVHIRRLREKVEELPSKPKYIMTKWGTGYYYNVSTG